MGSKERWEELREQAMLTRSNAEQEMHRAVALMEEALGEARVALSRGDPEGDLPTMMVYLASMYHDTRWAGWLDKAIPLGREAVAIRRTAPPDVLLGNDLMFLAQLLASNGQISEAVASAEEALPLYEQSMGKDHPEVGYMRSLVGRLQAEKQRRQK